MGKMEKWGIVCIMAFAGCQAVMGIDWKSVQTVMENMMAAKHQENSLAGTLDETDQKRNDEKAAVLYREALNLRDLIERENLDNFKQENRTYKRVSYTVRNLANNISYLLEGAQKNPGNMIIFYNAVLDVVTTAQDCYAKMVKLAMNSKVDAHSQYLPALGNTSGNDGANLLTSADRVEVMEDVIAELRLLNRAIFRMAWKLNSEVSWTYFFHEATPYHYRRINAIISGVEYAKSDIEDLHWF